MQSVGMIKKDTERIKNQFHFCLTQTAEKAYSGNIAKGSQQYTHKITEIEDSYL